MCFSPQADLVGGFVVGGVGVDAWRQARGRNDHLLLAALPMLLGAHQLVEAFVWWGAEGHVPHPVGRTALWIYLLIAFVVLPVFVPSAVMALEPSPKRRWRMAPFLALGTVVSAFLLSAMIRGPVQVSARPWHLSYSIHLAAGLLLVCLYVLAICGALLFSGYRHIAIFGLANLVAVMVLALLTVNGFASLWCGYAALSAAAITLHMRYGKPHRDLPYVLT